VAEKLRRPRTRLGQRGQPLRRNALRSQRFKGMTHANALEALVVVARVFQPALTEGREVVPEFLAACLEQRTEQRKALPRPAHGDAGQAVRAGGAGKAHQHGFGLIVQRMGGEKQAHPPFAAPSGHQAVARGTGAGLKPGRGLVALPAQHLMGKSQLPGPLANPRSLGGGLWPQAVIDGENGKREVRLMRRDPAMGEAHEGDGIGTAGHRKRHVALTRQGREIGG